MLLTRSGTKLSMTVNVKGSTHDVTSMFAIIQTHALDTMTSITLTRTHQLIHSFILHASAYSSMHSFNDSHIYTSLHNLQCVSSIHTFIKRPISPRTFLLIFSAACRHMTGGYLTYDVFSP